jgi:hypothetical protein
MSIDNTSLHQPSTMCKSLAVCQACPLLCADFNSKAHIQAHQSAHDALLAFLVTAWSELRLCASSFVYGLVRAHARACV